MLVIMMGNRHGTGSDEIPGVGLVEWSVRYLESSRGGSWSKHFGHAHLAGGGELSDEQLRTVKAFLHVM